MSPQEAEYVRQLDYLIAAERYLHEHGQAQEPFATIFAHKANIASRLGVVTERTLYRHLDGLKTAGLIEVLPLERKSRNGRYAVARIRLTRKAAELIELESGRYPHVTV